MKTDLQCRARLHAALGEPLRLAIVDELTHADRTPTELGGLLGIGSNLMTHHLHTLESAGIVRRIASEGDGRKRFVQLVPSAVAELRPRARRRAGRVVFVCTENAARSQLAEALWNREHGVPATSAGTEPASGLHPGAVAAARRRGLALGDARPKPLPEFDDRDLVISVCDRAHDALATDGALRRLHWSIPDPTPTGTAQAFDGVVDLLLGRIAAFAPDVVAT